jgi:hypothetical protein
MSIRADIGQEFSGKMLDVWAVFYEVALDFSRPGQAL